MLKNGTFCLLVLAAVASLAAGKIEDSAESWGETIATLLATAIVLTVCVGFAAKKGKASNSFSANFIVTVVRGCQMKISSEDLVTGDVLLVAAGCVLPVDGLVLQSDDLSVEGALSQKEADSSESSLLFSGSRVENGRGALLVGPVGQPEEISSDLQVKLGQVACAIKTFGLCFSAAVFLSLVGYCAYDAVQRGTWTGENWCMLLSSLALSAIIIVVSVSEGLFLVAVLSLAVSVGRMKEENMLIKNLRACETMATVTDMCADKTGTLTQNRMTVVRLYINGKTYSDRELYDLGTASLLVNSFCVNSDAVLQSGLGKPEEQKGSATDCALLELAKHWRVNYEQIRSKYPSLNRVPFDSKWKWMATVADVEGERTIFLKGASERVIDLCEFINDQGQVQPFTTEQKEALKRDIVLPYSKDALRTIGLAYRQDSSILPEAFFHEEQADERYITSGMVFLGVVGFKDPVRPEVPRAVKSVKRAGVKVRLITGDNVETAIVIAKDCGILDKDFVRREGEHYVMEGNDFAKQVGGLRDDPEQMNKVVADMNAFRRIASELSVLARSTPEQKFLLVTGLQQMGRIVAVTGDGSNDAPALKKSNVGFAMNIAGTQLAKDAADIILMDDSFASVVAAVKWGRQVYDCVRKFVQFQITVNVVALTMCLFGAVYLHRCPLTAIQLLWVNFIMAIFAALAMAAETPDIKLPKCTPYSSEKPLINADMKLHIAGTAFYQIVWLLVILLLGPELFGVEQGWTQNQWSDAGGHHSTIFFNSFVFLQVFSQLNFRKVKVSELNVFQGFCGNRPFLLTILVTVLIQVVMVQFGGALLRCSSLGLLEQLYCVGIGLGSLVFCFCLKWVSGKMCRDTFEGKSK